jgi:translation elongation factor EF-Tu-like GTPase
MHYAQHASRQGSSEVKRSADREEQTEAQHIEHASRKAQHVEGSEIEFEIEKIKGARMIRDTKPYDLVIKTAQPIQLHSKQRIIMRTGSETIGFGAIL